MNYYLFFAEYVSKSPYSYWILVSDESLIKFDIWSKRKSFNSRFYTEDQVLALIEEKYPNSIRRVRPPLRKKWNSLEN
jgi:hypothetical protein